MRRKKKQRCCSEFSEYVGGHTVRGAGLSFVATFKISLKLPNGASGGDVGGFLQGLKSPFVHSGGADNKCSDCGVIWTFVTELQIPVRKHHSFDRFSSQTIQLKFY